MNWLDYLILLVLGFGLVRGLMKGFAVSVTSFLAMYIAFFLALRLMHRMAAWLTDFFGLETVWVPFLGFLTVFVLVLLGVIMLGKALDRFFKVTALGWLNRLAGGVFGVLQLGLVVGLMLWLVDQVQLIDPNSKYESVLYGPTTQATSSMISWASTAWPALGDVLAEIDQLFDGLISSDQ
jgi:membrane protein required for colicin V production